MPAAMVATAWCGSALAYRPFDGTDAAVADPGQVEIELGPAGYLEAGSDRALIAPALVLNYGIAPRWEVVLQGGLSRSLAPDGPGASLTGSALFLKTVWREGSLQEKSGASIATEFGFLLPDINNGSSSVGVGANTIISQRWPELTVHVNAGVALTRQQFADIALSTIVEGPRDWPVRPVVELFYEHDYGGTETGSALAGAIWQVRESVALDVGLRGGWVNGQPLKEVRAGITFAFGL